MSSVRSGTDVVKGRLERVEPVVHTVEIGLRDDDLAVGQGSASCAATGFVGALAM